MRKYFALGCFGCLLLQPDWAGRATENCAPADQTKPASLSSNTDQEDVKFKAISDSDSIGNPIKKYSYTLILENTHTEKILTATWRDAGFAGRISPAKCIRKDLESGSKSIERESSLKFGHREQQSISPKIFVPENEDKTLGAAEGIDNGLNTRVAGQFANPLETSKTIKIDVSIRSYFSKKDQHFYIDAKSTGETSVAIDIGEILDLYSDLCIEATTRELGTKKGIARLTHADQARRARVYRASSLVYSFSEPYKSLVRPFSAERVLIPLGNNWKQILISDADLNPHQEIVERSVPVSLYLADQDAWAICAFTARVFAWKQ